MNTKFIVFEGIHGCGKTATAWILNKNLCESNIKSKVLYEADMDSPYENPCDLSFMSILDNSEFAELVLHFPDQIEQIKRSVKRLGEYYLLYYPDFNNVNQKLYDKLLKYQVYDGRLDSKTFKQLVLKRFGNFVETALKDDVVYVSESVIFQHIINELLRFSELSQIEISEFISEIIDVLKPLNRILFHLRTDDIKSNIDKIALERVSDNLELYPDWIDYMVLYVKNSKYGAKNNVQNRDDVIRYFKVRAEIEKNAFDKLNVEKYIVNIDNISKEELNTKVYNTVMHGIPAF